MHNADHRRAWDLICWVAAGSASDADRRFVQAHLDDCADCRDELAFQHRVAAGLHDGAAQAHDPEPALQRLMARIDAGDPRDEQPLPLAAPLPLPGAPAWTRWLAAAVMVQAVGLAAAGAALWNRADGGEYRTLTSPAPAAATAAHVRLVPAASMNFAGLQALLARHRLALVEASADGRSLGLADANAAPDMSALLQRLRAEPGVLLAEPIRR